MNQTTYKQELEALDYNGDTITPFEHRLIIRINELTEKVNRLEANEK